MDLSKLFDCNPRDILTTKLYVYGISFGKTTFLNSYLKERKQNVKVDDAWNIFLKILPVVQQGSILSPTLFNIFLNDLFLCLTKSELSNFADDNTLEIVWTAEAVTFILSYYPLKFGGHKPGKSGDVMF